MSPRKGKQTPRRPDDRRALLDSLDADCLPAHALSKSIESGLIPSVSSTGRPHPVFQLQAYSRISGWTTAVQKARKELGITGPGCPDVPGSEGVIFRIWYECFAQVCRVNLDESLYGFVISSLQYLSRLLRGWWQLQGGQGAFNRFLGYEFPPFATVAPVCSAGNSEMQYFCVAVWRLGKTSTTSTAASRPCWPRRTASTARERPRIGTAAVLRLTAGS